MNYLTNREIKGISRDKMLGKYGTATGAFLLMRGICYLLLDICAYAANPGGLIYLLIVFILSLIEGIFVYGEQKIYMKLSCGYETGMKDMLSAFKTDADRAIFATFLYLLILYVPIFVSAFVFGLAVGNKSFLSYAIICAVLLGIAEIYLLLRYSMVMLIMHDYPQMKVTDAYRKSAEIMKGRKKAFLGMFISFIPIHVLGFLTFFVGEIFIHPYYKMSKTEFYFDIVKPKESKESIDIEV